MSCRRRDILPRRAGSPPATGEALTPEEAEHKEKKLANGTTAVGAPKVLFCLTPSSSSIMSFPMEASVVHLQLLVALTAQRL